MTLSEICDKLQISCHHGLSNLKVSEIVHKKFSSENISTTVSYSNEVDDILIENIDDKNVSLTFITRPK